MDWVNQSLRVAQQNHRKLVIKEVGACLQGQTNSVHGQNGVDLSFFVCFVCCQTRTLLSSPSFTSFWGTLFVLFRGRTITRLTCGPGLSAGFSCPFSPKTQ